MKNELIFGVAYYPEYMPYDRIEKDIKMMKEAGMNTIRIAESTWSTLEPTEGVFDFSYIDQTIEVAKRENMQVVIGTPTYAIPSWLVKKDPEIMVTRKEGQKRYGHRQIMDIMNQTYRDRSEIVIRKLIKHVVNEPCVIGFQIDNETKHYGTAGKNIQELFKTYLIQKYQTVANLNNTFYLAYWSNSIHSWDDLPDMRGCINGGLASEFESFQRDLAKEFLRWQAEIVNEYRNEDQFLTHNLDFEWKKFGADIAQDGYSYGVQPDINHNHVAKFLTKAGTDIYHPTQDDLTGAEIAFGGDEIRCLKDDNYLVLECQAQAFKYWTPFKGQLRQHAYSHLASGAEGIMYWNWHSIHNGYETYWKGVLSHDLQWNETYGEASDFGNEWKRIGKDKLMIRKANKVALVVDNRSLTMFKWFPIDRDLSYNDVVRWVYDSLYESNVECDIVHAEELDETKYNMILTPALYCVSEAFVEKLKSFVKGGGVLISTFKSFVADQQGSVYHDAQPHNLISCFGMTYNQFTEPGKTSLKGEAVTYFAELLKVEGGKSYANYEHPYWGAYAGITSNQYGEGMAFYVGGYTSKKILKEIISLGLKHAKIEENTLQWPLVERSGENKTGAILHYIFNYSESEKEIVCPYNKVKDLITQECYTRGQKILVLDWGVLALEEVL